MFKPKTVWTALTSLTFLICDVSLDAPAVLIKAQWHEREQRFNTAENLCGVKSAGESSFIITNLSGSYLML